MAVWSLGFTLLDSNNKKAVTHVYLPGTLTAVHAQEYITAFAPLLDAITDCKIISATATLLATLPAGLKADPVANTDVEEGARFGWLTANNNLASNRIAGFKEGFMTGEEVDLTELDVIAFRNAIVTGLTTASGLASPVDSRGEDITALASARDQHQAQR